jgi:hypothetical protein
MTALRNVALVAFLAISTGATVSCAGPGGAKALKGSASASKSGSDGPTPPTTQTACSDRSLSVGPIFRREVITEISEVTNARSGKPFVAPLRPVRRVIPAVQALGVVDTAFVYATFAQKAGSAIAPYGEASPQNKVSGAVTVSKDGEIVVYSSVRTVEASFTLRCRGIATSGVVSSWEVPRIGIMQCDLKPQREIDIVQQAVGLACP